MIFKHLEKAFAVFGLFYMTGSAVAMLTPGTGGGTEGAPAYRLLGIILGLVSVMLMTRIPDLLDRLVRIYWPVVLLTVLVLVSVFWSPEPSLAFRRAGALAFTVAFGIYLAERFDARTIVTLILATLLVSCAASYVAIIFFPTFGIHQGGEALPGMWMLFNDNNYIHAGSWRGLFDHKNDFGRFAALCGMFFLIAAMTRERARLFFLAALALTIVLVVQSRSAQATVLLAIPGSAVIILMLTRRLDARVRGAALVLLVPTVAIALLNWENVYSSIVSMLGKDASLTGRTQIWGLVLKGLHGHYIFGGGYGTGMIQVRPTLQTQLRGTEIDNAHNGYLGALIDIGLVGLGLVLALFVGIATRALRVLYSSNGAELALVALGFCAFTLFGNVVGSYLIDYNSLYTVLLVVTWGTLRRERYRYHLPVEVIDRRRRAGEPARVI